jgi:DNA adenine methylase
MVRAVNSVLKYSGGKSEFAKTLIPLMPRDVTTFADVYFGGGSVLLQREPQGESEVANDIWGVLVGFWRVLQDREQSERFRELCAVTPFSEALWNESWERLEANDPVVRAHAFFILNRQCRQGAMKSFATLSRNRVRRQMNEQVSSWLTAVERLPEVVERLQRVVILQRDALDVIQQLDGVQTFFYCDPPYVESTRVARTVYEHEMSDQDHHDLVDQLLGCSARVMLSGYANPIYERLETRGWETRDFVTTKSSSGQKSKPKAVERIWVNYELVD